MADMAEFYLRDDFAVDEKAEKKHLSANIKPSLQTLVARLEDSAEIGEKDLEDTMKEIAAAENLKLERRGSGILTGNRQAGCRGYEDPGKEEVRSVAH
jgi:hypothetical protein